MADEFRRKVVELSLGYSLFTLSVCPLGSTVVISFCKEADTTPTGLIWPGSEDSNLLPDVWRLEECGHELRAYMSVGNLAIELRWTFTYFTIK